MPMRVCFIWHMHQPYYKDLQTGDYLLPWVRLHGVKDYLDMVAILDEFPQIKQCFNLVPSLIEQIEDYAGGKVQDRQFYLSRKRSRDLTDQEKLEITEEFFAVNQPTMIRPYPRYDELYQLCHRLGSADRLARLNSQDFLDLQVWFNASWIDPLHRQDERIRRIYTKGRDFSEAEKQQLLDYQIELMARIIPTYRDKQESGQIEVSFSPYYHPILPLLVDTDSARIALPQVKLPQERFAHPEDAEYQVSAAAELYKSLFGRDRFGMWPSEGSVSQEILPILARHGVTWIATDEEIYYASVNHSPSIPAGKKSDKTTGFHQPFLVGEGDNKLGILFRDHTLSDKIGFVYSSWDPKTAAKDFVTEIRRLGSPSGRQMETDRLVTVILDGENAWEYYQNDGIDFLRALYTEIERDPGIETVLPKDVFADTSGIDRLPYLFTGSWINHDFRIWIGQDEDNRAWDLLKVTRNALVAFLTENPDFDPVKRELAWKEVYIAEGSDWCWWYGDDHHSRYFDVFDRLFRRHLLNVWNTIGAPPPVELTESLRKEGRRPDYTEPTDWIRPVIDGKKTHFFEWFGAGRLECSKPGGAMHRAKGLLHLIRFGYGRNNIYLRLDFEEGIEPTRLAQTVNVDLIGANHCRLIISQDAEISWTVDGDRRAELEGIVTVGRDRIIEIAIARSQIEFADERLLRLSLSLTEGEKEVEKWPTEGYITFRLPGVGETLFWEV